MTIREAFEKAGHPVPGAYLLREHNPTNSSLWFSYDCPFDGSDMMFSHTLGRWASIPISTRLDTSRDYSDEPAIPFLDALPLVVQEVVKK